MLKVPKPRAESSGPLLGTPGADAVDALRYPDIADLMSRLHFSPGEGRIWLDDQRMVLVHTSAMGVLRQELIESLGIDRARGLLTRMGYNSGTRDAELARKVRPKGRIQDMFAVGPQLHMLEGIVAVEPVRHEIDVEHGKYYGEWIWKNSSEDEEHIRIYGIGAEPVCWMQIGYASGYTTVFMGRPILYREVMVRNGDAAKPVWASEVGWNAPSDDASGPYVWGKVNPEQQARYTVRALERARAEWPWMEVMNIWYLKPPDNRDMDTLIAGFRLLDPEAIGVSLTDEWELVPEQSTSALIFHHPDAKYYVIR